MTNDWQPVSSSVSRLVYSSTSRFDSVSSFDSVSRFDSVFSSVSRSISPSGSFSVSRLVFDSVSNTIKQEINNDQ